LKQYRNAKKTPVVELGLSIDAKVEVNGNEKELHVKAGQTD
jgi:hypothetical protein